MSSPQANSQSENTPRPLHFPRFITTPRTAASGQSVLVNSWPVPRAGCWNVGDGKAGTTEDLCGTAAELIPDSRRYVLVDTPQLYRHRFHSFRCIHLSNRQTFAHRQKRMAPLGGPVRGASPLAASQLPITSRP